MSFEACEGCKSVNWCAEQDVFYGQELPDRLESAAGGSEDVARGFAGTAIEEEALAQSKRARLVAAFVAEEYAQAVRPRANRLNMCGRPMGFLALSDKLKKMSEPNNDRL